MWNSLDLKCPSDDFSEYPPQDRYLTENLQEFVTVLSTAADTLTSENPLWIELQVLLNIQKKYKRILHCDKCLTFIHRVGTCTKKMVLLNLSKSYLDLAEKFLIGMQVPSMNTYRLPSRQQLEYVLIRTVTASKLVCQGIKFSRDTFCYLIQKLKIGHLILDLVMAASVIARLNTLLKATLEQLCSMYKEILSWRYQLKAGTFEWAQKLDFPQDLEEWLRISEPECLESFPMSRAEVDKLTNLLKPSNGDKGSDSSDTEPILIKEATQNGSSEVDNSTKRNDIDYGEVIPRKRKKTRHQLKPGTQKPDFPQDLKELSNISEAGCSKAFPMSGVGVLSNPLKPNNGNKNQNTSDTESIVLVKEVTQIESSVVDNIDCEEAAPRKKKKISVQLQPEQKSLLQKVLQVQSLKHLKELWIEISTYPSNHFPRVLTELEKENISKLFNEIEETVSEKKFNKIFKNEPAILKSAYLVFSKHLGFSTDDVESCRNELRVPSTSSVQSTSSNSSKKSKTSSNSSKKSKTSSLSKKSKTSSLSKKPKMSRISKKSKTPGVSKTSVDDETRLAPVKTLKGLKGLYKKLCDMLKFLKKKKKLQKLQKCFVQRRADIRLLRKNGERRAARKLIFCTSKLLLTQSKCS